MFCIGKKCRSVCQFGAYERGGGGIGGGYFLGGAGGYDAAAVFATFRPHVDHIVGAFHHIQVVLDD